MRRRSGHRHTTRAQHMRHEPSTHADDWLMTYADTITLLLCLFVVILSITVAREKVLRQPGYLPVAVMSQAPPASGVAALPFPAFVQTNEAQDDTGDDAAATASGPAPVPAPASPSAPLTAPPAAAAATVTAEATPVTVAAGTPVHDSRVSMAMTRADDVPPLMPKLVDRLVAGGPWNEQRGDRITSLEVGSAAFFPSGSATLNAAGKAILHDLATTLKSTELLAYQVTVEGHTDDIPAAGGRFPSNWELSTARAAAVVNLFATEGIAPQRLHAAGYADAWPVAPNRHPDGTPIPENQARNRRVVIKLERIEKSDASAQSAPDAHGGGGLR